MSPVQNPTFIFQYLCEKNGLTAGTDITIDNTYAQPAELNTALASGEVHIAVLPEPMVTIARAANPELTAALDLTRRMGQGLRSRQPRAGLRRRAQGVLQTSTRTRSKRFSRNTRRPSNS